MYTQNNISVTTCKGIHKTAGLLYLCLLSNDSWPGKVYVYLIDESHRIFSLTRPDGDDLLMIEELSAVTRTSISGWKVVVMNCAVDASD
jgi:hypothetical protein